jgi:hypothetical protein
MVSNCEWVGMMLENPIALAALICFLLGSVLSGLVRIVRRSAVASTVLPIIFLASYVVTYQQVPPFPPVGSTNKIFYIVVAATLAGLVLDLLPRTANYRRLLAVIMPLLIVGWIGFPRFAKPDIELIATVFGLSLGGYAPVRDWSQMEGDETSSRLSVSRAASRALVSERATNRSGCCAHKASYI